MKSSFLKAALTLLIPGFAMAQTNSFTVTGTALKSVNPDELVITAGIEREGKDALEVYKNVQTGMSKAMAYLKNRKGVKKYETDVVRMNKRYNGSGPSPFMCTQTITITLTDFTVYDDLMLELFEMGFNNISQVQFTVSKMAEIKRQVQLEAIAMAKEKAAAFADKLGVELGPVTSFAEQNFYAGPANKANYRAMDASQTMAPSIAPNQVDVMQTVVVSFAFKSEIEEHHE